jgi:hypothetical protein
MTNQAPTNIYFLTDEIYFPLTTPAQNLPVVTQLLHSGHLSHTLCVQLHGVPPGINHYFITADSLTRYGIKF